MSAPQTVADVIAENQPKPPSRFLRNGVVAVVVASIASAWVGMAMAPSLIVRHPLLMAALNSNNRYLILVTNQLDAPSFYAAALARRSIPTLAFFLLGRWYGERAVTWFENRDPGSGEVVRIIEGLFRRAGWWVVAIAPMPVVGLLAGSAKLRPRRVVPLVIASIAVRIVLLRQLGQAFSGPVDAVVRWIDRWRSPLLVVSIGMVLLAALSQRHRRKESLEELVTLDDDIAPVADRSSQG